VTDAPDVTPFPRREWSPLPREGSVGVDGRVLVRESGLVVAMLRFGEHANIDPHAGDTDTLVVCIDGEGFTSVAGVTAPLREGERVRWPTGIVHGLWTDGSTMTTLMIERRVAS
jgi:quercetin dioxygenase-like cupin family protein